MSRDGNGFGADQMKRTEIIIETRRVMVIQHHARSTEVSSAFSDEVETTKQTDAGQLETTNEDVVPREEKEICTDSRNR